MYFKSAFEDYVGKTTRIAEHRKAIRTGDIKIPVARHFVEAKHFVATLGHLGIKTNS